MSETIFAPLTLKGNCSVFVIRISGSKVRACLSAIGLKKDLEHRKATLCKLQHDDKALDEALVTYFQSPNSFTGEDVCEINLHCSTYIIKKIFEILSNIDGTRYAERGEFSKRAFLNGKIDLMQAESIADLINSETELQHQQAIKQLQGKNSIFYNNLRERIVKILSSLEAYIDFPDEHLPKENIKKQIDEIINFIEKNLNDEKVGERIKDGFKIAIMGEPNVGKSTLLNYLAKREIAIVSDIAGTTRDVIEVHLDVNGIPVILYDTAGIRETNNVIEIEGVKRAIEKARQADLKILLTSPDNMQLNKKIMELIDNKTIIVKNKCDLEDDLKLEITSVTNNDIIPISLKNNINIDIFIKTLQKKLEDIISPNIDITITNERYRNELKQALFYLKLVNFNEPLEICAENIRISAKHVGGITGKISIDELLDNIFSKFCIGK
ncbi:MAG: tRNA uridine-5-carboxymethylaminomethyl(34) synthesis GTPase MnmE [Rickettsiales bacterium]|jgi:tRNA modification GTPase|nr:tRNA uridine-5-carboxymethylaminomethyl(34) synthesis GTPase MnmE [Rickettsiales bacterium]